VQGPEVVDETLEIVDSRRPSSGERRLSGGPDILKSREASASLISQELLDLIDEEPA
jgi:hypothetical protein